MAAEDAICSFGAAGLDTLSIMGLSALAIGLFSVFGGKVFTRKENTKELEISSLA